jgi:hypothetical protein
MKESNWGGFDPSWIVEPQKKNDNNNDKKKKKFQTYFL